MHRGFWTLIEREAYRFLRLSRQTIAPPIITTLLFIFIFGYSLESRIREIEGLPYIVFILPGLAAMSVITNAYSNTSTSLFMARMDKSIENLLIVPVKYHELVFSLIIGSIMRGVVIGGITLLVSSLMLDDFSVSHWWMTLSFFVLVSVAFGNLGIISALRAESWDQIATFTNFIITPLVYLGGVFYSISLLPNFWQKVSLFNPIFYFVDATRYAVLGVSDIPIALSLSILIGFSLGTFLICVYLFKIGYKIRS